MAMKHAGLFFAFTLGLIYLLYPGPKSVKNKDNIPFHDYVLAIASVVVGLYIVFRFDSFVQSNLEANTWDYAMGICAVLLVLEATRRAVGSWMAILPIVFIIYALCGDRLPGALGHYGFSWRRFIIRMYMVDEGMFGMTQRVAATYVFMFVLFGAFLAQSGIGKFITDLAFSVSGKAAGGPAKVAVISSAMMGTISGSPVANTATTGTFTIPLMKQVGYPAHYAGAVEAAASTGGAIMPPIMGAAAFLIAEFLGISYWRVVLSAILPATLFYISIYLSVHKEAIFLGLTGLPADQLPPVREVLRKAYLMVPLIVIVVLIAMGRTPLYAAFLGIASTLIVCQVSADTRMKSKDILNALDTGARSTLSVSVACIASGIIVGVTVMTGLGQVITYNILRLSGGVLFVAMLLIATASIILTMGLPSTAAYIVISTVAAPALINMGVNPIAAHMFVFYYASLSSITPPVALASYTAAGIAGAQPTDVALTAVKLALPGFVVPFMFVYQPQLLLVDVKFPMIVISIITSIIGVWALSESVFNKRFGRLQRLMMCVGGLSLMYPGLYTDITGAALILMCAIWKRSHESQSRLTKVER